MEHSLTKRLASGGAAQAYTHATYVVIQLVTIPVLIHAWGLGLYGEWLIVSAIPIYLQMSDAGFTTAAQNDMTIAVGRGDWQAALDAFQSTWLLVMAISLAVVLVAGGAGAFLPLSEWLNLSSLTGDTFAIVFFLFAVYVAIGFQSGLLYAGFHCAGQYGLGHFLVANVRLLEYVLLVLAVLFGGGPLNAVAALVIGRIAGTIGIWIVLRWKNPRIRLGHAHARLATTKRLVRPAVAFMAFPLGNALNVQGMVLVAGIAISPVAAAIFSTLRTMTRFGLQLVRAVNAITMPEVSRAFGANDLPLLRKLHHRSCQVAIWGSVPVALGFVLFGDWLLQTWTNGAVPMRWSVFLLLIAVFVLNAPSLASLTLAYATNRHARLAVVYSTVNVLTLGLAYVCATRFGLVGIAFALIAAETVMAAYVLRTSLRLLDDTGMNFASILIRPPIWLLEIFLKRRQRYPASDS